MGSALSTLFASGELHEVPSSPVSPISDLQHELDRHSTSSSDTPPNPSFEGDPLPHPHLFPLGAFSVDEYKPIKVVVIGAGFSGILAGIRCVYFPFWTLGVEVLTGRVLVSHKKSRTST